MSRRARAEKPKDEGRVTRRRRGADGATEETAVGLPAVSRRRRTERGEPEVTSVQELAPIAEESSVGAVAAPPLQTDESPVELLADRRDGRVIRRRRRTYEETANGTAAPTETFVGVRAPASDAPPLETEVARRSFPLRSSETEAERSLSDSALRALETETETSLRDSETETSHRDSDSVAVSDAVSESDSVAVSDADADAVSVSDSVSVPDSITDVVADLASREPAASLPDTTGLDELTAFLAAHPELERFDVPRTRFVSALLSRAAGLSEAARALVVARARDRVDALVRDHARLVTVAVREARRLAAIGEDPEGAQLAHAQAGEVREVLHAARRRPGREPRLARRLAEQQSRRLRAVVAQRSVAPPSLDAGATDAPLVLAARLHTERIGDARAQRALDALRSRLPDEAGPYHGPTVASRALETLGTLHRPLLRAWLDRLATLSLPPPPVVEEPKRKTAKKRRG